MFKVRKEWLVDENGAIVKMTLEEWFKYFDIKPAFYEYECGITIQSWKSAIKKERNGFIDIERNGGRGLLHREYEEYKDKLFFAGNADFDVKLRQVY